MTTRAQLGRLGEEAAARHLERRGLEVVSRNWRPRATGLQGELDLVAVEGPVLVVCEVKTRRGTGAGHPLEAITGAKVARLRRLAGAFLAEADGLAARQVRLDAIAVCWPDPGGEPEIDHVKAIG